MTLMRFTLLALVTVPLIGCKGKDKAEGGGGAKPAEPAEAKPEAPIELTQEVDVGAAVTDPDDTGYQGLKVKAPAGAKAEEGMPGVVVRIGERAAYEITRASEPGTYVAKAKKDAQEDTLDKLVTFHVDSEDAVLWESKSGLGGDNNFHFVAEVKVGDKPYKCGNKGWGNFTKAQATALLESCKSLAN
jgi:hypothetical protein